MKQIIQSFKTGETLLEEVPVRRFSPHIQKIKELTGTAPMNVIATMNAGHIPADVWVHDLKVGGGRIIGEACHFIDLITFLTGSRVKHLHAHNRIPHEASLIHNEK